MAAKDCAKPPQEHPGTEHLPWRAPTQAKVSVEFFIGVADHGMRHPIPLQELGRLLGSGHGDEGDVQTFGEAQLRYLLAAKRSAKVPQKHQDQRLF